MTAPAQRPESSPPGTRRGTRKWLRVLLCCLLLVAALAVAGWFALFGRKKTSPPYRMAVAKVQEDPTVQQQLGTPVRDVTWFPTGRITGRGGRREARFHFTVAGPKGTAAVSTVARYIDGSWGLTTLDVLLPNGRRHAVPLGQAASASSAPRWPPAGQAEPAPREPGRGEPSPPPPGHIDIDLSGLDDAPPGQ